MSSELTDPHAPVGGNQALVSFENQTIALAKGESLLDGLTRTGNSIPSGCRLGACQACMMVMTEGEPSSASQQGLSAPQRALQYVLSCQCKPDGPVSVGRLSLASQQVQGIVLTKDWLKPNVLRLRVKAELNYRAGQYVTLWQGEELARSYSLASVPSIDDYLEFHIKHVPGGALSPRLCHGLQVGDAIGIQGPLGQCFYTARPEQALLLIGIGTGLAPLVGILRDALHQGHTGPIALIVGGVNSANFYLQQTLVAMAEAHEQLTVQFIAQTLEPALAENLSSQTLEGDLYQFCHENYPDLKDYRVFLCGAESFVKKMRKQCFLDGAAMSDISADAFLSFS